MHMLARDAIPRAQERASGLCVNVDDDLHMHPLSNDGAVIMSLIFTLHLT